MTPNPILSVVGVNKRFSSVHAVNDLSFDVERGQIFALLGPNGAGKTTMLRMLATLLAPDRGRVRVHGFDTVEAPLEVRARLGYLTGDTGLYGRLTPKEFLYYFGRLRQIPEPRLKDVVSESMQAFGIDDFAQRRCGELSTGQKQRVSLARCLLDDPRVVVLDEPTSGLDIVSSSFVMQTLLRAREDGRAVLFSTHVLSEVELLADRILVMHKGRLLAEGTTASLTLQSQAPSLSHAFLQLIREADEAEPS